MKVDLNKWYRCKVDKEIYKKLTQRSDYHGLKTCLDVVIFFNFDWIFCFYNLGHIVVNFLVFYIWKYIHGMRSNSA